MSTYKPTEHDGLREDGQPDKRVGTGEFAYGKVDPHTAGQEGGKASGTGNSVDDDASQNNKRSGNGNSNRSGGSGKGEFAHGKVDPHEAGRKGGQKSGTGNDEDEEE